MRTMRIKMQDDQGRVYHWTVKRVPRFVQCFIGHSRIGSGWEFTDHDGTTRTVSGQWNDLVAQFKLVAGNYGFLCNLS